MVGLSLWPSTSSPPQAFCWIKRLLPSPSFASQRSLYQLCRPTLKLQNLPVPLLRLLVVAALLLPRRGQLLVQLQLAVCTHPQVSRLLRLR